MKTGNSLTRRDFTLQSALAILSGVTITITGCGDSPSSPSSMPESPETTPSPTTPSTGDVIGVISANHGHQAVITRAELTAGNAIELDIRGQADHTHTVSLSAEQIDQIAMGAQVSKSSSVQAGHAHSVTFN